MYPDPSRLVFGHKTLAYFEQDMARFLSQKGVMPILIPDLPAEGLNQFLSEMDGFCEETVVLLHILSRAIVAEIQREPRDPRLSPVWRHW